MNGSWGVSKKCKGIIHAIQVDRDGYLLFSFLIEQLGMVTIEFMCVICMQHGYTKMEAI